MAREHSCTNGNTQPHLPYVYRPSFAKQEHEEVVITCHLRVSNATQIACNRLIEE